MPCLNTFDLVAYPGSIYVTQFTASSGTEFRELVKNALISSGWSIVQEDIASGANPGTGFKGTSQAVPWCASGSAPAEFVGKCKVYFYPFQTSIASQKSQTEFKVMNESETMVQSSNFPKLKLPFNGYEYLFIGNAYQFTIFLLGIADRVLNGIGSDLTAIIAGTPQIPSFLQTRGGGWCEIGVEEMFFIVDASQMRTGPLVTNGSVWCGGIKSQVGGSFVNNNVSGSPFSSVGRYGLFFNYGVGGGGIFDANNLTSGYWVYDPTNPTDITKWDGLFWPPIISWVTDPANSSTTNRLKGFTWASVILNKNYPGDQLLNFAGHDWIVFNNNWQGLGSPLRPPGSLLFAIN